MYVTDKTRIACTPVAFLNNGDVLAAAPAPRDTDAVQTPGPGAKLIPPYDGAAPQIYDPTKGQWHSASTLVTGGALLNSATVLGNGTVLVAGGSDNPYFIGSRAMRRFTHPRAGCPRRPAA